MAQQKFVVLKNRDLAVINGSTGLTKQPFDSSDVSASNTVTFATTNPCVAVIDNDGIQWDLNSKRVWYSNNSCTIDITDALYGKGLITTPARFTTDDATYQRNRSGDSESGYSWVMVAKEEGATNVPTFLYTKNEVPAVRDAAYYSDTTTGSYEVIRSVTNAVAAPITGTWYGIFTVSNPAPSPVIGGITYDVINEIH